MAKYLCLIQKTKEIKKSRSMQKAGKKNYCSTAIGELMETQVNNTKDNYQVLAVYFPQCRSQIPKSADYFRMFSICNSCPVQ